MQILDGKIVSQTVKDKIKEKMLSVEKEGGKIPHLAAVLVGTNGASETYVASKVKNCAEVGFKSTLIRFDDNVAEAILLETIQKLNKDEDIDGILIQLPLPKHINEEIVINSIDPNKDVDGFHPLNAGKMMQGLPTFIPDRKSVV